MKITQVACILAFCTLTACLSPRKIRISGVKGVKLGEKMIPKGIGEYKGYPVKDTIYKEGGFVWRAAILDFPEGRVWVEEDFFEKRYINRIRIETPDLKYKRQFKVGTTIAELREWEAEWTIVHMPEYNRLDLYANGVHFLIHDQGLSVDMIKYGDFSIFQVPADRKVLAIVVM